MRNLAGVLPEPPLHARDWAVFPLIPEALAHNVLTWTFIGIHPNRRTSLSGNASRMGRFQDKAAATGMSLMMLT